MSPEKIIRRPIVLTEKASLLRNENKVVFEVARDANKIQIKHAVETLFSVKVKDVHTLVMRGKDRRMGRGYAKMQNWKKAMVTLADGANIDFFDENAASAS
ncbi:MAG: 50S ribosomal protein L23 [Polyangiaceae bacterium]